MMSQTRRIKLLILSCALVFTGLLIYHFLFKFQRVVPIYVVEEHHEGKIFKPINILLRNNEN